MNEKRIWKVPFETPYGVTYHNIKAQDQETIRNNREKLHAIFKGDGLVTLNTSRYAWQWFEGSTFEVEL